MMSLAKINAASNPEIGNLEIASPCRIVDKTNKVVPVLIQAASVCCVTLERFQDHGAEYRHIFVCRNRKIDVTDVDAFRSVPAPKFRSHMPAAQCREKGGPEPCD